MRVVIADDHALLRAGLRSLLTESAGLVVVGEAGDGDEAISQCSALQPDLILLDIAMPGTDGIKATQVIKQQNPEIVVLMLTAHEDAELLREALRAGASGYVVKRALDSELLIAIQAVLRGDLYIHPSMTRALLGNAPEPPRPTSNSILSPRELEILRLLSLGYTNVQISEALTLSVRTVQSHRASLTNKLGLRNRADLVRYARDTGLLPK